MFHIYVRLLGAKPKLEHMGGTNGGDNIEPSHPPMAPVPRQERFASSILASILKLLRLRTQRQQKPEPSDLFRIFAVPSIFWTGQQCTMVFLPGLQTHSILTCHCSETFSISIQVVRPLFQESHSLSSLSLFLSSRFPHFNCQVFDLFPCFMCFSMSHVSCFFNIILQLQFHFNVEAFLISALGNPHHHHHFFHHPSSSAMVVMVFPKPMSSARIPPRGSLGACRKAWAGPVGRAMARNDGKTHLSMEVFMGKSSENMGRITM